MQCVIMSCCSNSNFPVTEGLDLIPGYRFPSCQFPFLPAILYLSFPTFPFVFLLFHISFWIAQIPAKFEKLKSSATLLRSFSYSQVYCDKDDDDHDDNRQTD